ncbi:Abortive bacteriophage infection, resistance (plasmid) [Nostoc flagelliforme CCNUN1]|uniref:Abortive bacteriophage infection, resistance n=1 Tax=Nostoc flagelliforme CCNUN1 TaxID=2038116 RepID=A0A2K8TBD4_9NOSO|nr:AIPR family protein [Nostoc flagelliforme]AUB44961.1 Abortive bacteriophage infection, resistance [Nostoc flagelliforme CCNUN1]
MPKTWNIKIDNYFQANPNCIIATAHVDSFPIDLPLEPNIREPNRKSATYRQIFDSLTTEPAKFFSRHSGIVLSANIVKPSKTSLELEVLEASEGGSDGIINGGHTVLAFEQAKNYKYDLTEARVKVTIHIGLTEESAKDIALASNTTTPVDSRSKVNARGDYKFIKQYLAQLERAEDRKFRIAYYQNQSGAPRNAQCNVTHLLKLLYCLDRNKYNPDGNKRTKHPAGMSLPSNITDAERERLTALLPLLSHALWIEQRLYEIIQEYISNPRRKGANDLASIDIRKTTLLPDSKYSFGFGAPTDLALPIIASYRVFLDQDYKWIIPFDKFAEDFLQHLWTNYFRKYLVSEKTAGNTVGTKISRNQEIWESLYISAQSYLNSSLVKMVNSSKSEEPKVTQGANKRGKGKNDGATTVLK